MLNTSINGEPPPRNGSRTVRFGAFEADLHSGEVRKSGNRVKLQDQPFKVLQILLERPGDLIFTDDGRGSQEEVIPGCAIDASLHRIDQQAASGGGLSDLSGEIELGGEGTFGGFVGHEFHSP